MNYYISLKCQKVSLEKYSIEPIRSCDRYLIMTWRNEQMYHLRQEKPLTKEDQDLYFETTISKLFNEKYPDQILFSYLKEGICIGYGGLVHINWHDRNAEISFIMKTKLEKNEFDIHWTNFLSMIEDVAFIHLNLIKIYTYAFDLRPKLYPILENCNYKLEARLHKHKFFENKFIDILIHSKIHE